jgi:hypothetical protein
VIRSLQWKEFGTDKFYSLGPGATLAYAREAASQKERELNSFEHRETLQPVTWTSFIQEYLDTFYPGHGLEATKRNEAMKSWGKSWKSWKREQLAINAFARLMKPDWCHKIGSEAREQFIAKRLPEVGSPESVDVELRVFRLLFNVMEEWTHRPKHTNPFAGRGKATVGSRRKRQKERTRNPFPSTTRSSRSEHSSRKLTKKRGRQPRRIAGNATGFARWSTSSLTPVAGLPRPFTSNGRKWTSKQE